MDPSITFITGVTGLVGNNVCRMLCQRGRLVRALMRESSDPRPIEGLPIEKVVGELSDRETLMRAIEGADTVVHAAGYVHIGRSRIEHHREVNVEGTRNVAIAAREAGSRMIHVSSADVIGTTNDGTPADEKTPFKMLAPIPYVISKKEAEEVIGEAVAQGLDAVIVNPGFMLGPWDWKPSSGRMLLALRSGKGILAPRGNFSVCDVRDVAEGILSAVKHGERGERYIMAGETISYYDIWRMFAEVTKARPPLGRLGPIASWLTGKAGDIWGKLRGREPDINSGAFAIARVPKYYSSERAKKELGYQQRPLDETIQDAWDWFCQNKI